MLLFGLGLCRICQIIILCISFLVLLFLLLMRSIPPIFLEIHPLGLIIITGLFLGSITSNWILLFVFMNHSLPYLNTLSSHQMLMFHHHLDQAYKKFLTERIPIDRVDQDLYGTEYNPCGQIDIIVGTFYRWFKFDFRWRNFFNFRRFIVWSE